jgi:predicted nucleic acid-binding protein
MSKIFLDSNILAYGFDNKNPHKQEASHALLKRAKEDHHAVLSTQVLQELYVTATRKMGVAPLAAKSAIVSLEHLEIVVLSPRLIHEAIDCQLLNRIDFWDALIIAAAQSARCETIWTEDMNPGQVIRGVRIENPFLSK